MPTQTKAHVDKRPHDRQEFPIAKAHIRQTSFNFLEKSFCELCSSDFCLCGLVHIDFCSLWHTIRVGLCLCGFFFSVFLVRVGFGLYGLLVCFCLCGPLSYDHSLVSICPRTIYLNLAKKYNLFIIKIF